MATGSARTYQTGDACQLVGSMPSKPFSIRIIGRGEVGGEIKAGKARRHIPEEANEIHAVLEVQHKHSAGSKRGM